MECVHQQLALPIRLQTGCWLVVSGKEAWIPCESGHLCCISVLACINHIDHIFLTWIGILSWILYSVCLRCSIYLPHKTYVFYFQGKHIYLCLVMYKNISWPFDPRYKWWGLFLPNYLIVDYMIAPFNLLTWTEGIRFLRVWKFWGHLTILVGLFVMLVIQNGHKHHSHHRH